MNGGNSTKKPQKTVKKSSKSPKFTLKQSKSSQKSPKTEAKRPKLTKTTVAFIVFTLAWAGLSLLASQFIIGLPMSWILGKEASTPFWTLIYYILNYALTLALILLVPPRLWRQFAKNHKEPADNPDFAINASTMGVDQAPTFVDIGLAPIGYIAYTILASILTGAMSLFSWFNLNQSQDVGFAYFLTTGDRIMAMIAIVFIAPIAEELIMRGWVYGKVRSKLGAIASILLTSLLFGLLHGQWNVGVTVFALSIVLCGLREITGTIWSGILLHILSNGIAFYILYIAQGV